MMVANRLIPGAGLLNHAVNPLVTRTFSRSQEIDADAKGIEMVKRYGIMPDVYASMLSRLKESAEAKGEKDGSSIFDTHPALQERIDRAREMK
jgi:predicted Zn-dependent protease